MQRDEIVRLPEARAMFGSPAISTIYRWIDEGRFPRQIKLGARAIGFSRRELDECLERMKAERAA